MNTAKQQAQADRAAADAATKAAYATYELERDALAALVQRNELSMIDYLQATDEAWDRIMGKVL